MKLGEERAGEDLEIPLGKLHSVTGVITAASDSHTVNNGRVALLYADDKTEALSTSLAEGDAGFSLSFVPEGDYLLRVTDAADAEYEEVMNQPGSMPASHTETHLTHKYGAAEQAVHVGGDVQGLAVAAPELPRKATQPAGTSQR